ncbi:hypothetical protein HPB48_016412 [Haemaphysalis longicornis]|uniref:Uncharacterized protein n=1 Tax=Haemaphysalis longicornis TaxID=44386 RepID=A0A9J6F9I2_HAELO|nr:hypothetical protein HPB48_016412 [Haemaphysalis longicornis]
MTFQQFVIVQVHTRQNLMIASTADQACSLALSATTHIQLNPITYDLHAYLKPPPSTIRGVIHGLDPTTTNADLRNVLA